MTAEGRTWRVGIIGVSPAGLFLLERLSLSSDIRFVGAYDHDPARRELAANFGGELWEGPLSPLTFKDCDVVLLMDGEGTDLIPAVIRSGKHVVIGQPWSLSSQQLRGLAEQLAAKGTVTIDCLRRWSADFVAASIATRGGRLGTLHSARLSSCEQAIPTDQTAKEVLREHGFPWLDQLFVLVESMPQRVFARRFADVDHTNEHGFIAIIEFANGCTAQIEIQTRSRLSHRTGWMLEGPTGSYRGDRLYTTTADGEIVDESLPRPTVPANPFIEELISHWRGGPSTLPTLEDAARVMQLIEAIEQSADAGQAVLFVGVKG